MVRNYFKTSIRHLWKNRITTIINLFGLSIGMTAAVFILLWVQNEMSFDNYHPKVRNIYEVTNYEYAEKDAKRWEGSPMLMGKFAVQQVPEIKRMARLVTNTWDPPKLRVGDRVFSEKATAYLDSSWFEVFHYDFLEGSQASFSRNPFSIVLTETKAKKYFGDESAIGKVIQVDTVNYTVSAVVKDNPTNSSFQYDVMMQLNGHLSDPQVFKNDLSWTNFGYVTFLELVPGAGVQSVEGKLSDILEKNKFKNNMKVELQPLTRMYFADNLLFSSLPHGTKQSVYLFILLAALILLTGCINYVNLTTARASLRSKEVGVRKIAGAGKMDLFFQFMTESVTLSLLCIFITLLLVELCLPGFNMLTEKQFLLPVSSLHLWQILIGTLLFASVLNGIYPALLLSSFNPLNVFRGKNVLKLRDGSLRKALVVFQFSLATVLIIGAIVIFQQLKYVQTTNPGYNVSQVASIMVPYRAVRSFNDTKTERLFTAMEDELRRSHAIQDVCMGGSPIVNVTSWSSGNADWDGRDSTFNPQIATLSVDENAFRVFKLQVSEGRWFRPGKEDTHNYIINETALNELKIKKPVVGQRLTWGGDTGMIVGVVKDFHYRSLHEKIQPMVMRTNDHHGPFLFIKTYPKGAQQAMAAVETIWRKYVPDEPLEFNFLDDSFSTLYKSDIKTSRLILIFSLIAVLISALGLFGLAAFTTEQRTKEIGIRKVLGASVQQITMLLSSDFLKLVALSICVGIPIAWWASNKWLQDFAYRVHVSVWIFVLAGAGAMVVAWVSVGYQAIRAAMANPAESIRRD